MLRLLMKSFIVLLLVFTGCTLFKSPTSPVTLDQSQPFYFSANTVWQQKIPDNPPLDPNSGPLVAKIIEGQSGPSPVLILAGEMGSAPIYYTDSSTPRYPVPVLGAAWPKRGIRSVPIPDYARPALNSDGHICLLDTVNRRSYEFWQFHLQNGRWVAGNSTIFDLDGSGVSSHISARASGFSLLAGVIWPQELLAGNIPHALVCNLKFTRKGGPVAPASHSDGWSDDADAIPLGAHIQLDPALDIHSLGLDMHQEAILKALQEYGAYVADTTPSGMCFYAVNSLSFSQNPYTAIPNYQQQGYIPMEKFPMDHLRILQMGPQLPMGSGADFADLYY
jgi:hypothetical protein